MSDKELAQIPKGMEGMITADRPTGVDEGLLGNEGIGREDIVMPRIGLAQKTSPEIDSTSPRYIDGLTFMDLFNSMSKTNYGRGPLHFVILRRDKPRWIEFTPIAEGGGIKDLNVPSGDPRTDFTNGPNGERVKPVATMFYDFLVLLLTGFNPEEPLENLVALSFKSSGIKAAKHLNFLVQQRGQKLICKGVYELTTGHDVDKKTQGVYSIYKIKNAGWLTADSPIEKLAIEMYEAWKDRRVTIEVEPDADEFDPNEIERGAATTQM